MEVSTNTDLLHLTIRMPPKTAYEKISLKDISLDNIYLNDLKTKILEKTGEENPTFIHRGCILQGEGSLQSQGIKNGNVIQVIKGKVTPEAPKEWPKFTESDVQNTIWLYRLVTTSNFHKASRPEFLKKVLEAYPNLRNNMSAISILRDPILLASMGNPDTVRRMAEEYRELVEASKFIVTTLNNKNVAPVPTPGDVADDLDSSSGSDENNLASSSTGRTNPRITSNQLTQALGQVFASSSSSSTNSLANISQRNLSQSTGESTSASTTPNRITPSMFMNALSEVLQSTRSNNQARNVGSMGSSTESPESANPEMSSDPTTPMQSTQPMYLAQMQQMREMGLNDTETNLQALIVCNGDLETAINLVLSGGVN